MPIYQRHPLQGSDDNHDRQIRISRGAYIGSSDNASYQLTISSQVVWALYLHHFIGTAT